MTILITGIHGFVGTNLVEELGSKHTLYGLDLRAPHTKGVQQTFSWDDLDKGLVPAVDAIIHLAGKAHDVKSKTNESVYFHINTELTKKIYDYFRQSKTQKFIFFSSVKAAADFVPGDILTEEVKPDPVGPYGESKIKAEEYLLSHPCEEKKVYILRPCMIHGPGNKGNLNLLYGVVSRGIPWPLGAFDNQRTFTSIDNLKFVIKELLCQSVPSGIYNMADDEALSTNELVEVICQVLNKKARVWKIPQGFMKLVASVGSCIGFPLNNERLTKLTENYIVSNEKIKNSLQITKMPVSAKEGLIKTIQSFQQK